MWNLISMLLSCAFALIVAHLYYRRSAAETDRLKKLITDIDEEQTRQSRLLETVHDHAVRGTPDDSAFHYK